MPKVFVCYRRDDSAYPAQAIGEKLMDHYGAASVMFDVYSIPKGVNFVDYLNQKVSECDVLLAVIGDRWLGKNWRGRRRIDSEKDFVRIEIQAALERDIPVIPVLVGKANMPTKDALPRELAPLAFRNATEVRSGRDYPTHLERLVRDIEDSLHHASQPSDGAIKTLPQKESPREDHPEPPKPRDREDRGEDVAVDDPDALTGRAHDMAVKLGDVVGLPRKGQRWWTWTRLKWSVAVIVAIALIVLSIYYGFLNPPGQAITNSIGMEMILIEPDTFMMGSPEGEKGRDDDEEDQYQVTLTEGFYLGKHEVTQDQYERVMGPEKNRSRFKGKRHPVEGVTWFDAIEFCNRLSDQEDLPPYYEVKGKEVRRLGGGGWRLPTEAEWEYACRAGSQKAYCFGDDASQLKEYAWYDKKNEPGSNPVGELKANDWGLHDMHGNVFEWCWDRYAKYPTSPQENPTGSPDGTYRVYRGGCWYFDAEICRSAYRQGYVPDAWNVRLGFRVARSPVQ